MKFTLIVEPISKRIEVDKDTTVYSSLVALNYPIGALCGGEGTCGKCKILCLEFMENLSPLNSIEKKLLTTQEISKGIRLACQCKVRGDVRIMLLEGLISLGNKILVESDLKSLKGEIKKEINPSIQKIHLEIPFPDLDRPIDDVNRLISAVSEAFPSKQVSKQYIGNDWYYLSKILPSTLRTTHGKITVFFHVQGEYVNILGISSGHIQEYYGLAVDLGTTTIVGYLINLKTGKTESISSMFLSNPKSFSK